MELLRSSSSSCLPLFSILPKMLLLSCFNILLWQCDSLNLFKRFFPNASKKIVQKHSVDKLSSEMTFLNFINLKLMVSYQPHLHGLFDALGRSRVVLGVQVGQEERVNEC